MSVTGVWPGAARNSRPSCLRSKRRGTGGSGGHRAPRRRPLDHPDPPGGTPVITQQDISAIIGSNAVDNDGDKLGKVGQVYLDDQTGSPEWATVNTGLFGTHESFVPLADATVTGGTLRVPYEKAKVKDAPRVSAEQGHLTPDEEAELYRYYGVG